MKKRTRTRNGLQTTPGVVGSWTYDRDDDPGNPKKIDQLDIPDSTTPILDEAINDYTGSDGRFKPVSHRKITGHKVGTQGEALPRPPIAGCNATLFSPTADASQLGGQFDVYSSAVSPGHGFPSDQEWEALDSAALAVMLPSMNTGTSLVNFVLELKDFRFLFKRRNQGVITRMKKFLKSLGKNLRDKPLDVLSKVYLFNEFAVEPFKRDIVQILKDLKSFRARLGELEARSNLPQTRHYRYWFPGYDSNVENVSSLALGTFNHVGVQHSMLGSVQKQRLITPVYHATVRYSYTIDTVDGLIREHNALMDTLGVRPDPSIIWNAIPFSFIVDWFVDVQGFLERFALDTSGINVTIDDFCSSVRSVVLVSGSRFHWCNSPSGGGSGGGDPILSAVYRSSRYERRAGVPNLFSALRRSGLTGRKFALSSALLIANRDRLKRKNK